MPALRTRRLLPFALAVVLGTFAGGGNALAAKSRIVHPESDAKIAPRSRAVTITPVMDAMRETSPGVYEGIVPVHRPDGAWQVDLDERFMLTSVTRLGANGRMTHGCVYGAAGLAAWRAAVKPVVTTPAGVIVTKWEVK